VAIITSTASVATTLEDTWGTDNQASLLSHWKNVNFLNGPLAWGSKSTKFGLFYYDDVVMKFANMSPTIPTNAKITSAILRGTAATANAAGFITALMMNEKDGLWDPANTGFAWRKGDRNLNFDADAHLRNTGGATLADSNPNVGGAKRYWGLRDNLQARNGVVGQSLTLTAGGTLGRCDMDLVKVGAPAGSVWVEIWSLDGSGLPAALLATSSLVNVAGIPGGGGAIVQFPFIGGNQIAMTNGQLCAALLNGNYAVSAANHIALLNGTGYNGGSFLLYGFGTVLDDQHYPLVVDFESIPKVGGNLFTTWVAPTFVAGNTYDTPSFHGIFQKYINEGSYAEGDPFCHTIRRSPLFFPGGNSFREFAHYGHATYPPVQLIVEWRRKNRQVI
jgi:hypothetical protein